MSNLPHEPEFQQAYKELVSTLESSKLFSLHPELKAALPVIAIPERSFEFRVAWEDDKGNFHVNRGYRVQFNSALGPYKGGLRFHPTVNLSVLKFLGFEQIFKNALTGLNMGGGKGGSDFDPKGKSDNEIRRFCIAFTRELSKHIGQYTDVPAGDINVGTREIGYIFGAFKNFRNSWEGVLTGKGPNWGGSLIRPEATGYGLVYYVSHMISYATGEGGSFKGKRVAISGSGNVAQYAALKVIELGGIVISMSDSKGTLIVKGEEGFTRADINVIAELKMSRGALVARYDFDDSFKSRFTYLPEKRPWSNVSKVDIALPCATENEVNEQEAKDLIAAGCRFLVEGSNMGSTLEAINVYEQDRVTRKDKAMWYGPAKAANCGGVAVSGLEMTQNSQRVSWTFEEVDTKLQEIMSKCFWNCVHTAIFYHDKVEGQLPSLVAGANIAGFVKVAEAMFEHGDWW
ncbi:NADP-dependent glutamate dehydrogenase [Rhizina undulata]